MVTRRGFNRSLLSLVSLAAVPSSGCSSDADASYADLVARTWRHADAPWGARRDVLRELVRYATLAANSHNSQPWRFDVAHDRITILPDYTRRCAAVDPDDHHLFASLGCAAENLTLAAAAMGLHATLSLPGPSEDAIRVDLAPAKPAETTLFRAITERQCTRAVYDGKPVPPGQLAELETAAREDGVSVQVFTDRRQLEEILEYVVAGNSAQMNDDAFVAELKEWIRFNEAAAVEHRDGLFSASSGNPTVPGWLGGLVMKFAFTERGENDKYREQLRSSAGVIAFITEGNSRDGWIRAGRSYQRFALQATALGLRHAFVNQAVEVPEVRAQFADYLGLDGQRPDLLVRFGFGPLMPRSLRRPVEQVLV